jgi:hypothetical protein
MHIMKRSVLAVLLGVALGSQDGCRRAGEQAPLTAPVSMLVRNNAFFDVVVYALPTVDVDSRVRLATVTGHSEMRLSVPLSGVRPGGVLAVYLHAIGSRYSWTSAPITVDPESEARLDIFANPDGSLSRSSLYLTPRPADAFLPS